MTYSTSEVCDLAGVSYRQLDWWVRQGVLDAAAGGASGSGSYRRWAPHQVAVVAVLGHILRLSAMNRPLAVLGPLVEFLDERPLRYWPGTRILVDGDGQVWRADRPGAPLVGTYIDLTVVAPVIGLIAASRSG